MPSRSPSKPKRSPKPRKATPPATAARPSAGRDRSRPRDEGFTELTWTAFDGLVRELVAKLGRFKPEMVIGIVKGGMFVGSAVAGLLTCEFVPVRLAKRSRDTTALPAHVRTSIPPEVKGRRVLIVDDVIQSGQTMLRALEEVKRAGAKEARSAALVVHRKRPAKGKAARPDWHALETDDLVVFPWDYELRGSTVAGATGRRTDDESEAFGA